MRIGVGAHADFGLELQQFAVGPFQRRDADLLPADLRAARRIEMADVLGAQNRPARADASRRRVVVSDASALEKEDVPGVPFLVRLENFSGFSSRAATGSGGGRLRATRQPQQDHNNGQPCGCSGVSLHRRLLQPAKGKHESDLSSISLQKPRAGKGL